MILNPRDLLPLPVPPGLKATLPAQAGFTVLWGSGQASPWIKATRYFAPWSLKI